MALFSRRKPGFAKEVTLKPEDIVGEFSDRNDPAIANKNSSPKDEKNEWAKRAQDVMDGTAQQAQTAEGETEKMDLFEYMDTLPEVEDPFPPSEPEEEKAEEPERKPPELLAEYIRERSRAALITPRKPLEKEEEFLDEMIAQMQALESCEDIKTVQGEKDVYFYSDAVMANNYAMIAMLVEEKDLARTIAHMVRFNCKTYPSPTPLYYFKRSPYSYTVQQIEHALHVMQVRESDKDIKSLKAFNGVVYLYSEDIMSQKYAQALANSAEANESDPY